MTISKPGNGTRNGTRISLQAGGGKGLTLQQVADHNSRVTLEAIRRDGPLTRKELASRNGLTSPGVSNIVRKLSADGLIVAQKRTQPNGRSGSTEFALRAQGAFSVGVRLGKEHGEAVLLDLAGSVWKRREFALDKAAEEAVCVSLRTLIEEIPSASHFSGIGIGLDQSVSISTDKIQDTFDNSPVLVENDCAAAVLSERVLGVGAVEGGLMYVLVGESVRAGLLLRDKPFSGVHGRAGQIGKLRTGTDHISLDEAAGLAGLHAAVGSAEISRVAAGGDLTMSPALAAWVHKAARHLLDAIVATAGFLAPGMVLIGGDLPRQINDLLVEHVLKLSEDFASRPFSSPWMPEIRGATFQRSGVAIGAALLPFFNTLLPSPFHDDPVVTN